MKVSGQEWENGQEVDWAKGVERARFFVLEGVGRWVDQARDKRE